MKNPTPFVLAQDAKWIECGLPGGPVEYRLLPARVYLHPDRAPAIVVPRRARAKAKLNGILVGERLSSGFSGLILDAQGRYAGSIRKAIRRV